MRYKITLTAVSVFCCILLFSGLLSWKERFQPVSNAELEISASRALLLLEKSSHIFAQKGHCASCHHNTLTSMAAAKAVTKGIPIVDSFSRSRVGAMVATLKFIGNNNLMNTFVQAKFLTPYQLLGLYAEKYPAGFYTDLGVDYLLSQACADGSFQAEYQRPPLESGNLHLAALCIRAIQLYAPAAKKAKVEALVTKTRAYLEKATPEVQQENVFQLLGLHWCGADAAQKMKVAEKLVSMQNADGGWSQLPTMKSDAYATGQALYALSESRMIQTGNEVYQNGLRFLLKTQDNSGAWVVITRANPIQPFFNSEFPPYNENQFISATASNWAVLSILNALPDKNIVASNVADRSQK